MPIRLLKFLKDMVWIRETKATSEIKIHDIYYAGKTWNKKIDDVISRMRTSQADIFVVTGMILIED
jgi:hypothetical protein